MIKIDQTIISSKDGTVAGNCFRACIASVLEIDIDDIPKFEVMESGDWHIPFFNFLKEHNCEFEGTCHLKNLEDMDTYEGIDGYHIAFGTSHREWVTRGHSVIYKGSEMVHDPHPNKDGLKVLQGFYMIKRIEKE